MDPFGLEVLVCKSAITLVQWQRGSLSTKNKHAALNKKPTPVRCLDRCFNVVAGYVLDDLLVLKEGRPRPRMLYFNE